MIVPNCCRALVFTAHAFTCSLNIVLHKSMRITMALINADIYILHFNTCKLNMLHK